MATYYYDAEKVEQDGQRVQPDWDGGQPRIPEGQRLVAVMKGTRTLCADVTDPDEYDMYYAQYSQGYWRSLKLYLIRETSLEKYALGV